MLSAFFSLCSCSGSKKAEEANAEPFNYVVDQFADMQILRYQVPGFEELTLKQKELLYYLNEAALQGRDILYDQNGKHNLCIRRTMEAIYQYGNVDKTSEDWKAFEVYLKRVWV